MIGCIIILNIFEIYHPSPSISNEARVWDHLLPCHKQIVELCTRKALLLSRMDDNI